MDIHNGHYRIYWEIVNEKSKFLQNVFTIQNDSNPMPERTEPLHTDTRTRCLRHTRAHDTNPNNPKIESKERILIKSKPRHKKALLLRKSSTDIQNHCTLIMIIITIIVIINSDNGDHSNDDDNVHRRCPRCQTRRCRHMSHLACAAPLATINDDDDNTQ